MPATYQVFIDDQPLTEHATWGELETIHGWPGDCLEASWSMTTRYKAHGSVFHRDAVVTATLAGYPVWGGLLQEPEWNGREAQVTARGWYRVGENYPALGAGASALTAVTNPLLAIAGQQARGLPWRLDASVPNADLDTDPEDISVAGLCDRWAEKLGATHWGVDPTRRVYFQADAGGANWPDAPVDYHVPVGAGELSHTDDFASHVILAYANTGGGYSRVIYPPLGAAPTAYERQWGHNDWRRDISDLGPVDDATAAVLAQRIYERAKIVPAWSNGLQLLPGELYGRNGSRASFATIRGNQVVRVHGVRDVIRQTPYVDFTIGKVTRKQGEKPISIDPVGVVATSAEDIYQQLLEEAWAATGRSASVA